jgi:hypothetical protein
MSHDATSSLPEAALALQQSWRQTYDDLLAGKLEGTQVRGRWRITRRSLERLRRERAEAATANA